MLSGQERSSMKECSAPVEKNKRKLSQCCYGAQGCTAAPSLTKSSSSLENTANGSEQRKDKQSMPGSEPKCQTMKLDLSPDASMQDLYLILSALYDGGFDVSVSVQATPSKESAPSPSDTAEQCGSLMEVCPLYESPMQWAALWACLRSTTPSSKRRGSLGKLQEGRQ